MTNYATDIKLNNELCYVMLCPGLKSRVTRDRLSLPPESTRNTYHALPALTLPVPSVPCTTRGQRH